MYLINYYEIYKAVATAQTGGLCDTTKYPLRHALE